MKTIDEILDEFYNKMKLAECDRDPRNGGDIEVDDAFTEAKQAIATMVQEIIGSNDYIPTEDVDGLVNNNRLVRDGLRHEQRKRANLSESEEL